MNRPGYPGAVFTVPNADSIKGLSLGVRGRAKSKPLITDSSFLAGTVDFALLRADLGQDLKSAIQTALSGGAVFPGKQSPLAIFRQALASSIRNIETHPRGRLFQEFLKKGPYEDKGNIPATLNGQRLSDHEVAEAITFIYSHMVNSFKGAVTELLATRACSNLMKRLQDEGELPKEARLYVGDSVSIPRPGGKGLLKGADLHILIQERGKVAECIRIAGVAEVKSYLQPQGRLMEQIGRHLLRTAQGLQVGTVRYAVENLEIGYGRGKRVLRIAVVPSDWKLPRSFHFEVTKKGKILHVDRGEPLQMDEFLEIERDAWLITLRWSKEALAEAAYEMTFWYMGKVGEIIYSESVPKGWEEMSPLEAGRNAAKMMLYYAILRTHTLREEQRAIALYNSYGYGYSLGMNYKDAKGRREMLWAEDLNEILARGVTSSGCSLH